MKSLNLGTKILITLTLAILVPQTVGAQNAALEIDAHLANVNQTIQSFVSGFQETLTTPAVEMALPVEPLYEVHEPQIRVGLYSMGSAGKLVITAKKDFKVQTEQGDVLAEVAADTQVHVQYQSAKKQYLVKFDETEIVSEQVIRFVPVYAEAPFELVNYSNPNAWYRQNDNMFRGIIEFRFNDYTWRTYVINELWLEDYVKGIGEANNTYDKEFYKVLAVVTRSYALHYTINETKYPHLNFDVRPTTHDQLYRGYNYEKNVPLFQEAVLETRAQVVTYEGKPVVTPYFAQSAGKTYSYRTVWGGYRPWLQGTYDKYHGNYLAGHGVGMPLMGAVYLVKYDNMNYDDIIKYYYHNVDISPFIG